MAYLPCREAKSVANDTIGFSQSRHKSGTLALVLRGWFLPAPITPQERDLVILPAGATSLCPWSGHGRNTFHTPGRIEKHSGSPPCGWRSRRPAWSAA